MTAGAGLHGRGARERRDAAADRQRAQRDLPGAAARLRAASPATAGVRRIVLTASGGPFRTLPLRELDARDARRGVRPSQLGDGTQDLGRLGDDDEQGPRGDRGALAVQRRARRDRGRHPSARASSIRWSSTSTARCSRSSAIRTCARRSPTRSGFPERIDAGVEFLDLARIGALHFEAPDLARFPCLRLAYAALRGGRDARPTALNAANEVAVAAVPGRRARASRQIPALIEDVLAAVSVRPLATLEDVLAADRAARERAERWLRRRRRGGSAARPLRQARELLRSAQSHDLRSRPSSRSWSRWAP